MAQNLLQQYFPMLWVREELEERIRKDSILFSIFQSWKPEQRDEFLDFCTGERGVKILYDCFFKEVFNAEYAPECLEELMSFIMNQKVRILQVLPNEDVLHCFEQKSDTGLELNLLQKYYFVPLDIFRKKLHNKGIKTKLDAWLVFLTCDEPERIAELIQAYPEFKRMYEDVYELCRNMEDVMGLFSKELQELDRNTVQYMIDLMQDEIDASKKLITEQEVQLKQLLKQQELTNQLYTLLSQDERVSDLNRAFKDEAFRKQLLAEYHLIQE